MKSKCTTAVSFVAKIIKIPKFSQVKSFERYFILEKKIKKKSAVAPYSQSRSASYNYI